MTAPNIRALKLEMTLSFGELEDLAQLLAGAIEALEEAGNSGPTVFYDLVDQYEGLRRELREATEDLFGVEEVGRE